MTYKPSYLDPKLNPNMTGIASWDFSDFMDSVRPKEDPEKQKLMKERYQEVKTLNTIIKGMSQSGSKEDESGWIKTSDFFLPGAPRFTQYLKELLGKEISTQGPYTKNIIFPTWHLFFGNNLIGGYECNLESFEYYSNSKSDYLRRYKGMIPKVKNYFRRKHIVLEYTDFDVKKGITVWHRRDQNTHIPFP